MHAIVAAAGQAWPPFVLVAGLLLIGAVAAADGLFEAAGVRLAGAPLGARSLLLALLALVAVVSAMLNLDTAVVFLTPVLVHASRQRRLDERPFLYGSVFMANAGSLLLPGSNLTNLLVLRSEPQPGIAFAGQMLPAWITACTLTAAFLALAFRLEETVLDRAETPPPLRLDSGGTWTAAGIGAITSVLMNNLPAAVLLSAQPAARPHALLLGLDLGPNLAVTGSLSAVLWLQAARRVDAQPSITTYTRLGLLLVPLTLTATLAAR